MQSCETTAFRTVDISHGEAVLHAEQAFRKFAGIYFLTKKPPRSGLAYGPDRGVARTLRRAGEPSAYPQIFPRHRLTGGFFLSILYPNPWQKL